MKQNNSQHVRIIPKHDTDFAWDYLRQKGGLRRANRKGGRKQRKQERYRRLGEREEKGEKKRRRKKRRC